MRAPSLKLWFYWRLCNKHGRPFSRIRAQFRWRWKKNPNTFGASIVFRWNCQRSDAATHCTQKGVGHQQRAQVSRRLIQNNMHILSHDCSTKIFFSFFLSHFFGNFIWKRLRHRFSVDRNKVYRENFRFVLSWSHTSDSCVWTIPNGTKWKEPAKYKKKNRDPTQSQSWRHGVFHKKQKKKMEKIVWEKNATGTKPSYPYTIRRNE